MFLSESRGRNEKIEINGKSMIEESLVYWFTETTLVVLRNPMDESAKTRRCKSHMSVLNEGDARQFAFNY